MQCKGARRAEPHLGRLAVPGELQERGLHRRVAGLALLAHAGAPADEGAFHVGLKRRARRGRDDQQTGKQRQSGCCSHAVFIARSGARRNAWGPAMRRPPGFMRSFRWCYGPKKVCTLPTRAAFWAAVPYASIGKARNTTLYVPENVSASVAAASSVNAGVAAPFGVISSSNAALRTLWSSG